MKIKEHTRNQKRMYRIHKQEEKIQELELLVGELQRENNKLITQQKEFINFLEDNYKETQDIWYIKILQKYKSIIGDDK